MLRDAYLSIKNSFHFAWATTRLFFVFAMSSGNAGLTASTFWNETSTNLLAIMVGCVIGQLLFKSFRFSTSKLPTERPAKFSIYLAGALTGITFFTFFYSLIAWAIIWQFATLTPFALILAKNEICVLPTSFVMMCIGWYRIVPTTPQPLTTTTVEPFVRP